MIRSLLLLALAGCDADQDRDDTVDPPKLVVSNDPEALTDLARQAVDAAPTWLQDALAVNLAHVESEVQDEMGALIVDLDEPWIVDEVAFTVAHLSPEVLASTRFHKELLVENARMVYAYDESLPYVALVEDGEAGVDADWSTTATYRVEEEGEVVEKTIDRDLYYWYVVHPRLEDEQPWFLDAWDSDGAVDPDDGAFWREFLWDEAADECPEGRTCPLLADVLPTTDVVWKGKYNTRDDNGAIGVIVQWVQDAINFGAGSERPIQPSRIYTVGAGNCGEHADLSCAAARTGLIPCQNVGARSNDHTWNEFWDDRWVAWEPINNYVDFHYYYADSNGDYYRSRDLRDNDCDGTADDGIDTTDHDLDGWSVADGDCDDTDPDTFPGAVEMPDAEDDDCNGIADDGYTDAEADGDGDGYSIAEGDCDETDAATYPGADEVTDGEDDDCDGIADDGSDESDADGDGYSIAEGDCDDTDRDRKPGASEDDDAKDDDCNGIADDGLAESDRDGDNRSIADGDCDDTNAGVRPGTDDPVPSSNRVYIISDTRGDTLTGTERTEDYGTAAYLDFTVTDEAGNPVDGAVVSVWGTWAVYGYPDYPAYAGEVVTDLDGHAVATVGEANPYYYAVKSDIGWEPPQGYLTDIVAWTEPGETYTYEVAIDAAMPPSPEATEVDLTDGAEAEAILSWRFEVQSQHTAANGGYMDLEYDYLPGSFSREGAGGRLDAFVVDDANYLAFTAGEPFEALAVAADAASGQADLPLPRDRAWTLVLSNRDAIATTVVADLTAGLAAPAGVEWTTTPVAMSRTARIPPGQWLALCLLP
jgi:hypothetical protein